MCMRLCKKIGAALQSGLFFLLCIPFVLIASIVIHISGLDKVDDWPDLRDQAKQ